jgi:DegV family protein with EDD domain
MKKIGMIIDSTSYLSKEEIKEFDLIQVSLNIIDKDKTYKESEVDVDFVYNKLDDGHRLTTSQPSPGEFLDAYQLQFKKGYKKLFVICISEPLSGTYQSANLAKKMLDDPDSVYIFRSNMAAFGNEMLTSVLHKMIEEGKTEEYIITRINSLLETSNLIFTIENMISLYRSGRISKAKAAVGSVLRLKPLIQMIDGKLDLLKSPRTHKGVLEAILLRLEETTKGFSTIHVRILSQNSIEQARTLEEAIKAKFKNVKVSFNEYLGPVFSLHLGKRGYGVSWCAE